MLGVTGRTGSGKSMLTSMLADRCSAVLDADCIYAELLRTDRAMLDGIAARFPGTVRDGVLDRKALGAAVFSDDAARLDLNRLTHPAVFRECARRIGEAAPGVILLDVPLLFESGIDRLCDLTLGVTAPKALSLARIMARDGISEQAARARFDSQPNDRFYERRCDLLLRNDGGLDEFRAQIAQLFDRYLSDDPR